MIPIVGTFHLPVPCWVIVTVMCLSAFIAAVGPPNEFGAPLWVDAVVRGLSAACTIAAGVMVARPSGSAISSTTITASSSQGQVEGHPTASQQAA